MSDGSSSPSLKSWKNQERSPSFRLWCGVDAMASEDISNLEALKTSMEDLNVQQQPSSSSRNDAASGNGVEVTCFTEVVDDVTIHLQIIHLGKQVIN